MESIVWEGKEQLVFVHFEIQERKKVEVAERAWTRQIFGSVARDGTKTRQEDTRLDQRILSA